MKDSTAPRIVYRDPGMGGGPRYVMARLDDLRWVPAHVAEYHEFDGRQFTPRKRQLPDAARILTHSSVRDMAPGQIGDFVRRPSARALARIEAAEKAIADAQAELKAAKRAAFSYGKPIPVSTVKVWDKLAREHAKA